EDAQTLESLCGVEHVKRLVEQQRQRSLERFLCPPVGMREIGEDRDQVLRGPLGRLNASRLDRVFNCLVKEPLDRRSRQDRPRSLSYFLRESKAFRNFVTHRSQDSAPPAWQGTSSSASQAISPQSPAQERVVSLSYKAGERPLTDKGMRLPCGSTNGTRS